MARGNGFTWNGDKYAKRLEAELRKRVDRVTLLLFGALKKLIKNSADGAPSAPKQPPNYQTGSLLESTGVISAKKIGKEWVGHVGVIHNIKKGRNKTDPRKYALYLEYGTVHMDARPFLSRTLMANRGAINGILYRKFNGS